MAATFQLYSRDSRVGPAANLLSGMVNTPYLENRLTREISRHTSRTAYVSSRSCLLNHQAIAYGNDS